jgi:hypothetical protein
VPLVERLARPGEITSGFHLRQHGRRDQIALGHESGSTVRISSEDQLESLNDALFLRIYRLSSLADAAGARSLNGIVTAVAGDASVRRMPIEAFDRKLVAHGYAPLPGYDQPRFVVSDVRSYRASDGFPRLVRSQLPTGIASVAYDIRLETIAPFECDECRRVRGGLMEPDQ